MTDSTIARKLVSAIGACALLLSSALQPALACTGIRLIAEDGTVVHARTLEFGLDLHSKIMMVPRGHARTGTTPDGKDGMKWKAKYASVGLDGAGLPVLFDGVNEKGLATGTFYFPTCYAQRVSVSMTLTNRKARQVAHGIRASHARLAPDSDCPVWSQIAAQRDREGRGLFAGFPLPAERRRLGSRQNGPTCLCGTNALALLARGINRFHLSPFFGARSFAKLASSSASNLSMVWRFEESISLFNKSR